MINTEDICKGVLDFSNEEINDEKRQLLIDAIKYKKALNVGFLTIEDGNMVNLLFGIKGYPLGEFVTNLNSLNIVADEIGLENNSEQMQEEKFEDDDKYRNYLEGLRERFIN
jgi:hypothetical protein